MVQQQSARAEDFWWAEPATQQKLLTDPIGVLKEMGINVPANVPIPVAQEVVRLNSLLWLDGQVISRDQFKIDPADEGLLFGRGVWESTRVIGGLPWLWSMHIERLKKTAELLRIEVEPERLPDSMAVSEFVRSLTKMDVVIRLNLTAGRPGKKGIVWMTAALPPAPLHGVRLQTRTLPMEKGHPYLLWKTFQYATRLEVGQQSMREGFDTCLLVDEQDNLLEAAHANLFVRLQDGWATPLADGGCCPVRCADSYWNARLYRSGR